MDNIKISEEIESLLDTKESTTINLYAFFEKDSQPPNNHDDIINTQDLVNSELVGRQTRRVYFVTYSRVDLEKFPSRASFANAVVQSFLKTGNTEINHWACCQENHVSDGIHYHLALSLQGLRRWKSVKSDLLKYHNISVHFTSKLLGYVAAYR